MVITKAVLMVDCSGIDLGVVMDVWMEWRNDISLVTVNLMDWTRN